MDSINLLLVGGMATGKTTLLNSIAKAIDSIQFRERSDGVNLIQEPPEAKVFTWSISKGPMQLLFISHLSFLN